MSAALLACAALLGGCVTDGYGYGPGGYYDSYYGYPGYGYGPDYGYGYGWYGDYYYPGSGIYVYDRAGRPSRWTSDQQRYWNARRADARDHRGQPGPGVGQGAASLPSAPRQDRPGLFSRDPSRQGRPPQPRQQQPGAVSGQQGTGTGVSRQDGARPQRFSRPGGEPGAGQSGSRPGPRSGRGSRQ